MSIIAECFQLVKGFWTIVDAYKHVEINKNQSKTLAERRNHVMEGIQKLTNSATARARLESFDERFLELLNRFNKKNFGFKMLFNKTDREMFESLNKGLTEILNDFPRLSNFNESDKSKEDSRDIVCDFKGMKDYFFRNLEKITPSEKIVIKANFEDFLPIVESVASSEFSLPLSSDSTDDLETVADSIVEDIQMISDALDIRKIPERAKDMESTDRHQRHRSATTIDEKEIFLRDWSQWFETNVRSVRPSKRRQYATLFYDNNLTNERRLVMQLKVNSKWMLENGVDTLDEDDIQQYLRSKEGGVKQVEKAMASATVSDATTVQTIQYADGTYVGEVKNGKRNGRGKLNYIDGSLYEGDWKDDRKHGRGKKTWATEVRYPNTKWHWDIGAVYDGEWMDDEPNGYGQSRTTDGRTFEGKFKNGLPNGIGKDTWSSGDVYEGGYKDGNRNGIGKYTWPSGDVYEGDWKDSNMNGRGKKTCSDGSVYEGDWKDDKMNGRGKKTWPSGEVYEGDWKDGNRNGRGKMTWPSGEVYEGDSKDDKRNGIGKYTWPNGDVYEGDWKDSKMNGRGKMTWPSGEVYEGDWKDSNRNGRGKKTWSDGSVYEGDWKDGNRNGRGKMTWPSGEVYEGDWKDDKRTGRGKKNM